MNQSQIKANEQYFTNVINTLAEGGVFGWKDMGEALIKRGNKLQCSQRVLDKTKEIVSKEYFEKHFELKK